MRALLFRHKLVTFLLAWSAFTAAYLLYSHVSARVHFEQYMRYASFAPEWQPTYVEMGPHNFWTMWVPKFGDNVTFGEETFFVPLSENARLMELCRQRKIPTHGTSSDNTPYAEAAVCITPALLALWLLWRRRERRVIVRQLGCGRVHGAEAIESSKPAQVLAVEQAKEPSAARSEPSAARSEPSAARNVPSAARNEASAARNEASAAQIRAMQHVHVFRVNSPRREFIKRL